MVSEVSHHLVWVGVNKTDKGLEKIFLEIEPNQKQRSLVECGIPCRNWSFAQLIIQQNGLFEVKYVRGMIPNLEIQNEIPFSIKRSNNELELISKCGRDAYPKEDIRDIQWMMPGDPPLSPAQTKTSSEALPVVAQVNSTQSQVQVSPKASSLLAASESKRSEEPQTSPGIIFNRGPAKGQKPPDNQSFWAKSKSGKSLPSPLNSDTAHRAKQSLDGGSASERSFPKPSPGSARKSKTSPRTPHSADAVFSSGRSFVPGKENKKIESIRVEHGSFKSLQGNKEAAPSSKIAEPKIKTASKKVTKLFIQTKHSKQTQSRTGASLSAGHASRFARTPKTSTPMGKNVQKSLSARVSLQPKSGTPRTSLSEGGNPRLRGVASRIQPQSSGSSMSRQQHSPPVREEPLTGEEKTRQRNEEGKARKEALKKQHADSMKLLWRP